MPRVLTITLIAASVVAVACSDQTSSPQPQLNKSPIASDGSGGGGGKTDTSVTPGVPDNPVEPTTPAPPSDTVINPLPQPAGIHGYVVGPVQIADSTGQAGISGVRVSLVRASAEVASTTTASSGSFGFGDVADGVYLVRATPSGGSPYAAGEQSDVTVRDGRLANGSQVVIVLKKK